MPYKVAIFIRYQIAEILSLSEACENVARHPGHFAFLYQFQFRESNLLKVLFI